MKREEKGGVCLGWPSERGKKGIKRRRRGGGGGGYIGRAVFKDAEGGETLLNSGKEGVEVMRG